MNASCSSSDLYQVQKLFHDMKSCVFISEKYGVLIVVSCANALVNSDYECIKSLVKGVSMFALIVTNAARSERSSTDAQQLLNEVHLSFLLLTQIGA